MSLKCSSASIYTKHFAFIYSFNHHNQTMKYVPLLSFHRWENLGTEKLSNFPKVAWSVSDRRGIETKAVLAPEPAPLTALALLCRTRMTTCRTSLAELGLVAGHPWTWAGLLLSWFFSGTLLVYTYLLQMRGLNFKLFLRSLTQNRAAEPFAGDSGSLNYAFLFSRC